MKLSVHAELKPFKVIRATTIPAAKDSKVERGAEVELAVSVPLVDDESLPELEEMFPVELASLAQKIAADDDLGGFQIGSTKTPDPVSLRLHSLADGKRDGVVIDKNNVQIKGQPVVSVNEHGDAAAKFKFVTVVTVAELGDLSWQVRATMAMEIEPAQLELPGTVTRIRTKVDSEESAA